MAINAINPTDLTFSLVPEAVFGVLDTAATRYELPVSTDQAPPIYKTDPIESNTKRPKRESKGTERGMGSIEWSIDTRLQSGPVINTLIESALSGKFNTAKCVASDQDSSFSVVTSLRADTAVSPVSPNGLYYVDTGLMVNSMKISVQAKEGATVSFGMLGTARANAETDITATVTAPPSTKEFTFKDLKNVKLGTTTMSLSSLEFSTDQSRELRAVCGTDVPVSIGTSGARKTVLTVKAYRESFAINSAVTGAPQSFSFEIGKAGNGFRVTIPGAIGLIPTDELSGSSLLVNIEFTAAFDDASGSGLFIEQL
jgi:hypothetical protein